MRSFEVIKSEVNRLGCRLQPTQHGAALIQGDSACFPGDPGVIAGRSFKQSVHIFAPGLKSSRNHKASLSSKLNQACIDGEPHNPFGFLSAAGVVNGHDELTKRQVSLPAIGFHGLKCKPGNPAGAMGCLPHMGHSQPQTTG
jgi:hypothetical protein